MLESTSSLHLEFNRYPFGVFITNPSFYAANGRGVHAAYLCPDNKEYKETSKLKKYIMLFKAATADFPKNQLIFLLGNLANR